ncbi:hypothetical protein RhiirA5_432858 [Rhizophagus irregularis]|uniref:FAR1 domain-containing protein n=1 Tax=Rhizophagus irregularis TaxID=588596 RepID=A0A2N0NSP3_9GLOM|nr:hypothetical protein RhiirA5_432858 [Rhizophagus irregularis]
MDVSEFDIQESISTLMIPYEEHIDLEEESGKVHQDDANSEQVKLSNITPTPQDLESEGLATSLRISYTYKSWEDVDVTMETFGKENGFTAIKKRLARHGDGSIKHRSFGCEFGGRYQSQKKVDINSHRDRNLKRQQCPWNANFNCPQNSQIITLTTFNNSHNHALFPADTEKYSSKYRCIPDEALEEIRFLTEHGNLPITTQRKLLKARFLTLSILDRDLTNVIQKYKVKLNVENDAACLLKLLIEHKSNDSRWFVEFQLDQENRLTRLFWMSPVQIAL